MTDITGDSAHLRELAAKCRRLAASLTDQKDVAALRQMAMEYEAMASRMEQTTMPSPLSRSGPVGR